jgi:hypothetical protein
MNFILSKGSTILANVKQTFGVPVEPLVYMMMAVSSAVGLVSAVHSQNGFLLPFTLGFDPLWSSLPNSFVDLHSENP